MRRLLLARLLLVCVLLAPGSLLAEPGEEQRLAPLLVAAAARLRDTETAVAAEADQVAALGYALHDVPHLLTLQGEERLVRGWSEVRERLESYQGDYPREAGAYWDYLGMLNLIDRPA